MTVRVVQLRFLLAFVHTIDFNELLTGCPSITYKIQAVYKYCDF